MYFSLPPLARLTLPLSIHRNSKCRSTVDTPYAYAHTHTHTQTFGVCTILLNDFYQFRISHSPFHVVSILLSAHTTYHRYTRTRHDVSHIVCIVHIILVSSGCQCIIQIGISFMMCKETNRTEQTIQKKNCDSNRRRKIWTLCYSQLQHRIMSSSSSSSACALCECLSEVKKWTHGVWTYVYCISVTECMWVLAIQRNAFKYSDWSDSNDTTCELSLHFFLFFVSFVAMILLHDYLEMSARSVCLCVFFYVGFSAAISIWLFIIRAGNMYADVLLHFWMYIAFDNMWHSDCISCCTNHMKQRRTMLCKMYYGFDVENMFCSYYYVCDMGTQSSQPNDTWQRSVTDIETDHCHYFGMIPS